MDNYPVEWAPIIVKAWLDDEFKELLETVPAVAFSEFGLTYESSEPFTLPTPPLELGISDSGDTIFKKPLVSTCSTSVVVEMKKGGNIDFVKITDGTDETDEYEIHKSTKVLEIKHNGDLEHSVKRD